MKAFIDRFSGLGKGTVSGLDIPYKVAYFHTAVHRTTFANPMLTRLRQRTSVRLQLP